MKKWPSTYKLDWDDSELFMLEWKIQTYKTLITKLVELAEFQESKIQRLEQAIQFNQLLLKTPLTDAEKRWLGHRVDMEDQDGNRN